jgi:hypothetical protein
LTVSRWQTEDVAAARATWLERAVQRVNQAKRATGMAFKPARHTLYLHAQGVMSWPTPGRSAVTPPQAQFPDFAAWCAAHPYSQARIFVSGHLLHSLVVPPEVVVADDAALRRYAQQQFGHFHGAAAKEWPVAVWLRPSSKKHASAGACALHGVDLAALQSAAKRHGVRLLSVAPMWSAGLSSAAAHLAAREPSFAGNQPRALALVEKNLVTCMVLKTGAVLAVQQRYLDAGNPLALPNLLEEVSQEATAQSSPAAWAGWDWQGDANANANASKPHGNGLGQGLSPRDPRRAVSEWALDRVGSTA